MNPGIKYASYNSPYKVRVTFTNDEVKEFDIKPYLEYPVYKDLKDENFCKQLQVFNGTIIWNDEIDLDPDTVYLESKELTVNA